MRVGLSTTSIFGHLGGYFFGNFRDKAYNIINIAWRYATVPCRPLIYCKMNDRVSTTPGTPGNPGNLLELKNPPGNPGNLLEFTGPPGNFCVR